MHRSVQVLMENWEGEQMPRPLLPARHWDEVPHLAVMKTIHFHSIHNCSSVAIERPHENTSPSTFTFTFTFTYTFSLHYMQKPMPAGR